MKIKNRQFLILPVVLILTISIAVTSCKKDKDDNPGESAKFSANVGGIAFKPAVVAAFAQFGYINVQGYEIRSGDTISLQLSLPDTITVNAKLTFEDNAGLDYFNVKKTIEFGNYGDSHGTVTFTTVDKTNKKIVGKFSGVLYEHGSNPDSVIVKDGQFNTTYE